MQRKVAEKYTKQQHLLHFSFFFLFFSIATQFILSYERFMRRN